MRRSLLPFLVAFFAVSSAQAQFSGGSGSEEDPYHINTLEQLQQVVDHADKHYIQISDIDAAATENWNNGKGFLPIGTVEVPFTGTYDGNNYSITGLTILREEDSAVGLFGALTDGKIQNVILLDVLVSGGWSVGGLVGSNRRGLITGSHLSGAVSGDVRVGGLVGQNIGGTVTASHASGTVTVKEEMGGGLVGDNTSGIIDKSHADSFVSGNAFEAMGGLIGWNSGEVSNSHATGDVTGQNYVGGLAGFNEPGPGRIVNSYATGTVSGELSTGGLVGGNAGEIIRSYSTGKVTGKSNTGGLVGSNFSMIFSCYSFGDVSGVTTAGGLVGFNQLWGSVRGTVHQSFSTGMVSGEQKIGGLVGDNRNHQSGLWSSYWNTESSGQTVGVGEGFTSGATGLEMSEMTGPEAFDYMNLDFYNNWLLTEHYPVNYWEESVAFPPPPPTVNLFSPSNNQSDVSTKETLRWGRTTWIDLFQLQISLTSDFSELIVDDILSVRQYTMDLELETTYYWRVRALYDRGEADWHDAWSFKTATTVSSEYQTFPSAYRLHQNYPNPFNPGTIIQYDVPEPTHVTLEIFNSLGQLVAILVDRDKSPGSYEVAFDGTGLPSGVYVYRIRAGSHSDVRQMVLVK